MVRHKFLMVTFLDIGASNLLGSLFRLFEDGFSSRHLTTVLPFFHCSCHMRHPSFQSSTT